MNAKDSSRRTRAAFLIGVGVAVVVGLGAGTAVAAVPGLLSPAGLTPGKGIAAERMSPPQYEQNSKGRTFGSALEADSPETEPDLILVVATNGEEGYVFKSELDAANGTTAAASFTSPEDALEWQENQGRHDQIIPVYREDGTTKIGTFIVFGGDSQKKVADEASK